MVAIVRSHTDPGEARTPTFVADEARNAELLEALQGVGEVIVVVEVSHLGSLSYS